MKNKNNVHPLLHALLPVGITLLYILIGFTFDTGWAIGWILFLLIPIIETLINAINTKDASKFAYPVFVTAIFLFTGMMWGWWHPIWVVFVTIPAYYAICDYAKKSKTQDREEMAQDVNAESNQGAYYQPPVENKKSNTPVIITVIVCVTVIIIVAIVSTFAWLGGKVNIPIDIHLPSVVTSDADDSYTMGGAELSTDGIESIDIEWVDGNVDVEYYDGDIIVFTEDKASASNEMCYKIDDRTLCICEYKNSVKKGVSSMKSKDLSVKIPSDFATDEFSLEVVSATVNATDLNTRSVDVETVSGTANLTFATQPKKIDAESVSGDVNLNMPKDITGYSVEKESVSGSLRANGFDNKSSFGDGYTKINFESVSGNLIINKR